MAPCRHQGPAGQPASAGRVTRLRRRPIWSSGCSPAKRQTVVGHRHHRTPHLRGQGLLRGRAGHLLPAGRRLVDRLQPDRRAGHQRAGHGHRQPRPRSLARSSTPTTACNSPPGPSPTAPSDSGLVPSMGSIGDCYDNAMIESFWGRMQTELLNRKRWRPGSSWPTRSSTTWRSSTTANDGTPPSACALR